MDFTTADFKAAMGRFVTGVTVVTTALGSQRAGITVNAFCSVSLDPPLVLVCIERTAHIHDLLIEAGVFAVNLLERIRALLRRLLRPPQHGLLRLRDRKRPDGGASAA